jgi:hypothetical protein
MLKKLTYLLLAATVIVSCKKSKEDDPTPAAATYDGSNYMYNASVETALRTNLDAVSAELRKGNSGSTVDATILSYEYTKGGANSLANQTTTAFKNYVNGIFAEAASASGGATWTPAAPVDGDKGGRYGSYYFDENGVEILQVVEKGSFTAAFYNRLLTLTASDFSNPTHVGKVDALIALFGAHPTFKNSNNATKHGAYADKYAAGYVARRDKNDGNGLYTKTRDNFIKLQGAINSGNTVERNAALLQIKRNWEKGIMATVVNYSSSAIAELSKTSPTDGEVAAALHAISEMAGFISGFSTIPSSERQISDADINILLDYIHFTLTGTPEVYKFATDPVAGVANLTDLKAKIKSVYSFSDAEMNDFNSNWVSIQDR